MDMQSEHKNKLSMQTVTSRLKEKPETYSSFKQWWKAFQKYRKDQSEYAHLLRLNAYELRDVGVTRYDVVQFKSKGFPWPRF